ncbi:hypothetical protein [Novosphingobium rosa]|uniref:hypothetical protein n=1 Tax=Novosphingobium rosa TaxID=76978 RepID=UPI00082ABCA1|nr:hypothetical protein [Novosphingobium rosa]
MTQIVTRLFDNFSDAQHAVLELERVGVPHGDISLVSHQKGGGHAVADVREPHDHTAGDAAARDAGVGAALGGVIGAGGGALAGLGLLAIPGLGPVIAAGWLASAAVGAAVGGAVVAGAGGIVGALTHSGVSREEADVYAESVRRGGTLVSAKVDDDLVLTAQTALDNTPYVDIAQRRTYYQGQGWTAFDDRLDPYTDAEIEAERARWR